MTKVINLINGIDISSLLKARDTFVSFTKDMITDRDKAGAIQAFEFCFELSWKTLKRILHQKGIEVRSPRDCFREAALNKLINNPELWFKFLECRNKTAHTYNENTVTEIVDILDLFAKEINDLIISINKHK